MRSSFLKRCLPALALASVVGATTAANAQASDWPTKPVTIVVPYAPGGNSDFLARLTAERLSKAFGQQFIVENRAGAGGIVAADYMTRQPADGYTLFWGTITQISIAPYLYKIKYDPVKDFVPIANIGGNPLVITVGANSKFQTLDDLIKFGRANPGKLTVGHAGVGSLSHLSASVFLHRAGIEATMVPYKGGGPALTDMIAGQTDMYSANISEIMPHAKSGRVRFLGVSSEQPIKQLPGVPAIAQTFPGHWVETWNGLLGPAGTPQPIVDRLAAEVTKILQSPDFQARLDEVGVAPQIGQTKDAFAQRIQKDMQLWRPIIERAGIKPE
ncbi:MAG TPA: tripartite tricarboxylate transporter substrate binding protein [Burkholderiaceae bacterium]|jgi:tripartite-type tricarboxylate transporter receptor subunit TctC|nr:tripartite tricarboxylate transporter substrate binding protein [Burkholderiaceae bacterium]